MALQNVSQPEYQPEVVPAAGSLPGLSSMVHSFLGLVQPNAFPSELLTSLVQQNASIKEATYKQVLLYEVGFLVCAAIGLLFIILVPLVGLCFCCCRCCGNCSGRMFQKPSRRAGCRRRALFASTLLVTTFILAGDICAFISNSRVSNAVSSSFATFNSTLENLNTFLRSVPQQVDFITNSSDLPVSWANRSLQDIGPILGGRIVSQLGKEVHGVLGSATHLLAEMDQVQRAFQAMNQSGHNLQQLQAELSSNLSLLQQRINHTLQGCNASCSQVSISGLVPEADFHTVPDVSSQLALLSNLSSANLSGALQQANQTLAATPQRVEERAQKVVADAQQQLLEVRQAIEKVRREVPGLDELGNVTDALDKVGREASHYEPQVTTYDYYRWIVGICLCCLVLLIVLCNLLGLGLGALGLEPSMLPTERGCVPNSGGNAFLAGVGFTFLFSWLLMLLVLVIFLVGGNVHTLVCQPWHSRQLLQFLDSLGLSRNFNLSEMLKLPTGTVTFSSVYNNCQHDESLWSTLQLGQAISLDDLLNVSQYTGEITAAFQQLNISLDPVTFLSESQKQLLRDVGASGLQPNFTSALQQLDRNLTGQDLLVLALQLEGLANVTDNATMRQELQQEASELRELQGQMETHFPPEKQALERSIQTLQAAAPQVSAQINATLQQLQAAQTFLDSQVTEIVRNESWAFLHMLLGYFEFYVAWAKSMLMGEVGRCGPAAKAVDVAATVACSYIVDSLNGFWFSLGWCTVFLLPSIILAVRLAKYYRRMKFTDAYESNGEALKLSLAAPQFKFPRVEMR
ncbi:prominin-1-A-like [Carettochelys insculpta]|uniref:prominin-1-A-like n=1 Tax=Carettochelys insculpta TaxID=44489 RepID=UPI003EBC310F